MTPAVRRAAALLLALPLLASTAWAVNLVPNPSFETYSACPTGYSNISQGVPWDNPNTGTSDYYNVCVTTFPTFPAPDVPVNDFGYQNARTGVGYAGFIPYSSAPDYREYLEAPLTSPMVPGASYTVTFYVNLADIAHFAIDRIGAYFSVGAVGPVGNYNALPVTPQIESPVGVFLDDTLSWVPVTGTFVASAAFDHITIGNFHDDATTNLKTMSGTWAGGSNYFVDDVSVEHDVPTDQACCLANGTCTIALPGECQAAGGTPGGAGSTCSPSPCAPTRATRSTWGGLKAIYR